MFVRRKFLGWVLGLLLVATGGQSFAQASGGEGGVFTRKERRKLEKAEARAQARGQGASQGFNPEASPDVTRQPAERRSLEERRQLRQDIEAAGQSVYGHKNRRERR